MHIYHILDDGVTFVTDNAWAALLAHTAEL